MNKDFGRLLKSIRLQYKEKQIDMANKLGVSDSYLSHLESGRKEPTDKFLEKLFDIYKISDEDIFNIENLTGKTDDYIIVNIAGLRNESKKIFLGFIANFNNLTNEQKKSIESIVISK